MFQQKIRQWMLIYLIFHIALTVIVLVLITGYLSRQAESEFLRQQYLKLDLLIRHTPSVTDPDQLQDFLRSQPAADGSVLAIFGEDSKTVASSALPKLELILPEIVQAQETGKGHHFRMRSRITEDEPRPEEETFGCVAQKADIEGVEKIFWISEPSNHIATHANGVLPFIWGLSAASAAMVGLIAFMFDRAIRRARAKVAQVARSIGKSKFEAVDALRGNEDWFDLRSIFKKTASRIRKRERAMKSGQRRSEIVLGSMIEGVLAIDPTGNVMLINSAAESMLGLESSDPIGRKLLDLIRMPELVEAVERTQLSRRNSETEIQTYREPKRTLSVRVAPLKNTDKPGVAMVLQDVTALRALERIRTDFVANVSHELKTPLASIRAYAETLKMGAINDGEKGLAFVEQIEKQADVLNSQIQDLLELARVESGKASFCLDNVRLNEAAADCIDQFDEVAKIKEVKLKFNSHASDPIIVADPNSVQVVLTNLISNAIAYTPAGGNVTVDISFDNRFGIVKVIDDGIGISSEHQSRVFERFYRVDKARSREAGGTGLGLAIVKHLVQAFDGSVELTSQIGKGSTFEVRFHLV